MRVFSGIALPILAAASAAYGASWGFEDATLKADAQSPPKITSAVFMLAVLFSLPALMGLWVGLGGNFDHVGKAFGAKPVAHGLFFGSIVAMEGVFFLYYYSWTLFQTLPVAGVVGIVAYVSGSRALTEVQERRLAGER